MPLLFKNICVNKNCVYRQKQNYDSYFFNCHMVLSLWDHVKQIVSIQALLFKIIKAAEYEICATNYFFS